MTTPASQDGSVDLFHLWSSYKAGFGSESEFWLGNENLHQLTLQGEFPARSKGSRDCSQQALSKFSEALQEGTAGRDSLSFHSRKPFTIDTDHDSNGNSCSEVVPGAWWYESCYQSNLNSHYAVSEATAHKHGINWASSVVGHPYHRVPMMLH
ncbi:LOW QUALITY PROTEIN: ficolin-3 [Urocitellus parryii]